jgi:hypothetical protein
LTSAPGATLGPAIVVDAAHPRARLQLSGLSSCQKARRATLNSLTSGAKGNVLGAANAAATVLH